jgi:hypothetical protein
MSGDVMNLNRIVLIGCGKSKAAAKAPARLLYTGPLFCDRRHYAEASGCRWFVVSALYGILEPDDVRAPYDRTVSHLSPIDRAAWAIGTAAGLIDKLDDNANPRGIVVELHLGAEYAEPLRDVLIAAGFNTAWPVRHLGIGEQRAWYRSSTKIAAQRRVE